MFAEMLPLNGRGERQWARNEMKLRTFKDEISNDPVAMCDFEEALLS